MIQFKEITSQNFVSICNLRVRKDQEDFVAANWASLAEAYAVRNEGGVAQPYGIYDGDTPVGFVMIGKGRWDDETVIPEENAPYSLWRLMIDASQQGKGYGKAAICEALRYVRTFPYGKADEIWLSYEPKNDFAKKLYADMGFRENGVVAEEETVAVRELFDAAEEKLTRE